MKVLSGHTSPDTAYLVDDYPYGFRLRCRIRYWLEYKAGKGFRFVSQTSNPKRGHAWNKPKASTYCRFGGAMYLNDDGHVTWTGLTEYDDVHKLVKWREDFGVAMPVEGQEVLSDWIRRKLVFEQAKSEGLVKMTVTCTKYGSLTDNPGLVPIAEPKVTTETLKSDYSPEQLMAMGRTLRADKTVELAKLS